MGAVAGRRSAVVSGVMLVLSMATGCRPDGADASALAGVTTGPSATAAAHPAGRYRETAALPVPRGVEPMVLEVGSDGRVFATTPVASAPRDTYGEIVELAARGPARTVARSSYAGGTIDSVATTRGWLAWTEASGPQGAGLQPRRWRIWAQPTGVRRPPVLLATSGARRDRFLPSVRDGSGAILWARTRVGRRGARADVWAWRPARGVRRVARDLPAGEVSLAAGRLVYLGPSAGQARAEHPDGADCWQLDLATERRTPLSRVGTAMSCAAAGERTFFTEHVPEQGLDDPFGLWQVDGGQPPRQVEEGYLSGRGIVVAGTHAVVWDADGSGVAYASYTGAPTRRLLVAGDVVDVAGHGDWLAFSTTKGGTRPERILLYRFRGAASSGEVDAQR